MDAFPHETCMGTGAMPDLAVSYPVDPAIAPRPLLVLIANDQEWSARSLETILGPHGFAVVRTYNGRQTLDLARRIRPDAVILDARLPDMDGLELCATLRGEDQLGPATPVIVTTSDPGHRGQQVAAYKGGAWDYVVLPLDGEVLLHRLDTYAAAKREADRLRDLGLLDPTTGLYNARGLARRAREIGAAAARRQDAFACVAFAPTGEGLGADDGTAPEEAAAIRIAERLAGLLRRTGRISDAVGRLGRTEFAILAPATEASGAQRLAERVREAVDAERIALDGTSGGAEHLHVRAGYYAVPNFAESTVDAVEIVVRAASALRQGTVAGGTRHSAPIQAFAGV
jgi:PleD family two-component response regulator